MSKSKLYAAFGEVELPCDIGTPTAGWIPPERKVRFKIDKLLANIAILKNDEKTIVMVSLDVLRILNEDSNELREAIAKAIGTDFESVMIAVTHNHCAPATADSHDTKRNDKFVADMKRLVLEKTVEIAGKLEPAVWGTGFTYENDITFNRRYILRNGLAFAHPQIDKTDVLCAEGPIDPQVGVICVRNMHGEAMGYVVNFACHPLFYGGQRIATASFPGVLRRELKRMENPRCVTVFIQGAAGDISHSDPFDKNRTTMESVGQRLAERSYEVALKIPYSDEIELDARSAEATVYRRNLSEKHIENAKRVLAGEDIEVEPIWHHVSSMPEETFANIILSLKAAYDKDPKMKAPIQAVKIGDTVWATVPCELFVRLGMDIKLRSKAPITYVAAYTNGQIGYVATPDAYARGGYETTPANADSIEIDTGTKLVDAVVELINTL